MAGLTRISRIEHELGTEIFCREYKTARRKNIERRTSNERNPGWRGTAQLYRVAGFEPGLESPANPQIGKSALQKRAVFSRTAGLIFYAFKDALDEDD